MAYRPAETGSPVPNGVAGGDFAGLGAVVGLETAGHVQPAVGDLSPGSGPAQGVLPVGALEAGNHVVVLLVRECVAGVAFTVGPIGRELDSAVSDVVLVGDPLGVGVRVLILQPENRIPRVPGLERSLDDIRDQPAAAELGADTPLLAAEQHGQQGMVPAQFRARQQLFAVAAERRVDFLVELEVPESRAGFDIGKGSESDVRAVLLAQRLFIGCR